MLFFRQAPSTPLSPAEPIPNPTSADLSKQQARVSPPRNQQFPPITPATTSSAASQAPPTSSQGGPSTTHQRSTHRHAPYPDHDQITRLRHVSPSPNIDEARPRALLSVPFTPSTYLQASETSSPNRLLQGPSAQATRMTVDDHSRHDNFGNTVITPIPTPQAQYSAQTPTGFLSQQTQQSMQPQWSSIQHNNPVPDHPRRRYNAHPSNMAPTTGMGPSSQQ